MKRHLHDNHIAIMVGILDSWNGKLTWEALVNTVYIQFGYRYSRQALERHERIKRAFQLRKKSLIGKQTELSTEVKSAIVVALEKKVKDLEAKNMRLEDELNRLLEQFFRWQYNAAAVHGMSLADLNRAIPSVNQTKIKSNRHGSRNEPRDT